MPRVNVMSNYYDEVRASLKHFHIFHLVYKLYPCLRIRGQYYPKSTFLDNCPQKKTRETLSTMAFTPVER